MLRFCYHHLSSPYRSYYKLAHRPNSQGFSRTVNLRRRRDFDIVVSSSSSSVRHISSMFAYQKRESLNVVKPVYRCVSVGLSVRPFLINDMIRMLI